MVSSDVPTTRHPSIHALGRVDDAELAKLYRRAWLFCLPSSYEGFGIPYIEAMASGLPVVATPNVGAQFVTDGGHAGVLVDATLIGPSITSLLGDPARSETLSALGISRVRQFSLVAVADQYELLYRRTINGRRKTTGITRSQALSH